MKIISGGQIGADIAALRAAKEHGLETGGWATSRFMTRYGPLPSMGDVYGLKPI